MLIDGQNKSCKNTRESERHDQFFLFVGAFDKSSSADDEGAPETKNL